MDHELDASDTNRFLFNKVCSLETLKPVSAIFDSKLIYERAFFEFELDHVTRIEWFPLMVEAMLLLPEQDHKSHTKTPMGSLVLCTLEEPGRGLLFPTFRHRQLHVHSTSSHLPGSSSGSVNKFITLANASGTKFTLRCPEEDQFLFWKQQLEFLFPNDGFHNTSNHVISESCTIPDESISRETSYTFSSKQEEIIGLPFQGLSIISHSASNLAETQSFLNEPPLELPKFSFVGPSLSPQLEQVESSPSLIEEPELKAFLCDDFDFSEFSTKPKRPLSTLEVTAVEIPVTSPVHDADIISLSEQSEHSDDSESSESSEDSSPHYHHKHEPSFVIIGDNESLSSIFDDEDPTVLAERVLSASEGIQPPNELATPCDIEVPSAVLPMRFPPCPPIPEDSVIKPTPLLAIAPKSVASPVITAPTNVAKPVSAPVNYSVRRQSVPSPQPISPVERVMSPSQIKRKASTGQRLFSAFKNFSGKLKSRSLSPSDENIESVFEMLDTTPNLNQNCGMPQPVVAQQQVQFPPVQNNRPPVVTRGNPMRAARALSKISEEVFFEDRFEDDEEEEEEHQASNIATASAVAMALPHLVGKPIPSESSTSSFEDDVNMSISSSFTVSSIGTAVDIDSKNETIQTGHSRNLSGGISLRSMRREGSNGSINSVNSRTSSNKGYTTTTANASEVTIETHKKTPLSSSTALMKVASAMVSYWKSDTWVPISEIPLSLVVSVTSTNTGVISCYLPQSERNTYEDTDVQTSSRLVFELVLGTSNHVRKRTAFDVHVQQDNEVYLFRLRSSPIALEFAKKVDIARRNVPLGLSSSASFNSVATSVSNSSLSSVRSAGNNGMSSLPSFTPLTLPLLSNYHGTGNSNFPSPISPVKSTQMCLSSNESTPRLHEPETLMLDNMRCRIFSRSTTAFSDDGAGTWVESGLARIRVYSVPNRRTMRRMMLVKPSDDEALIDARLPSMCFAKAGPVGLSISEPKTGEHKYLLRLRTPRERDQVVAVLAC